MGWLRRKDPEAKRVEERAKIFRTNRGTSWNDRHGFTDQKRGEAVAALRRRGRNSGW
jgi:hypothetical protein